MNEYAPTEGHIGQVVCESYEKMALRLQDHMRTYVPESWTKPVENVIFVRFVTGFDMQQMIQSYEEGRLERFLKQHKNQRYRMPAVQRAIYDFFDKGLHKPRPANPDMPL